LELKPASGPGPALVYVSGQGERSARERRPRYVVTLAGGHVETCAGPAAAGGLVRKEVFLRRVLKGPLNSEDHW